MDAEQAEEGVASRLLLIDRILLLDAVGQCGWACARRFMFICIPVQPTKFLAAWDLV